MDENQAIHIDAEAFLRYATAKKLNFRCPICGQSDFTLITTTRGRALILLDITMGAPDLANLHSLELLSVECDNCGNERLFKRDHLAKWLRENP